MKLQGVGFRYYKIITNLVTVIMTNNYIAYIDEYYDLKAFLASQYQTHNLMALFASQNTDNYIIVSPPRINKLIIQRRYK